MGTSIPLAQSTKDRLEDYRTPGHQSWDDTILGLMRMLPDAENLEEGCQNTDCEEPVFVMEDSKYERTNGIISVFYSDQDGPIHGARYFCSVECADEQLGEEQAYVPEHPDKVVVGGCAELRSEFSDATFYLDETGHREVGLGVPGAFAGTDSHGNEYDYVGEPVYIYNEGKWVQNGTVEEIIHEETHTSLILGRGEYALRMLNHPDDERREAYKEEHEDQSFSTCSQCRTEFQYPTKEPPEACPACGAAEW